MPEVVVVASSAIDAASVLARRLAGQGASIAVLAGSRKHLPEIAARIVKAGAPNVLAIPCDITEPADVAAAARRIEDELGPIDRWVNTSMTDWGYVCGTRAALDCMRERDHGTIVQVGAPRAVRMFSDGLRGELRIAGSHVAVETVRVYPFRRLGAAAMTVASVIGGLLLRRVLR